ncbi:formate-dependent phosphoribosylglycinamide formyltransferase [Francisella tularensis]|uniref:Formate-dependent phosphoribosylglycinamide formyltransferase n=1 Tax=Francisella tularensis subsp. tularensis (strain WY96-3418) TaxID=418136 RepID=PURT_FRATW|nr:formate-dependent phosphoribosylglycinamide formyltransferase [Francisella tularensis]A4IVS8.1 RecName: Full=Formate-dependent phosphoribosylglycinamide formyltransferase; AltName: Full=5'-phosphoribosylglycinamide transformylase 2; AltName: Full=Formate-dependent GAR transformylase; AltName: Full=GAR transformylase 2; Short=GART 2; AltName: Full=Non-folate glycinamide ribonucleotide transformylase; AltName: Full=Phosphoribosylglycinamide formyltransferase 2 [Francisella tularensis subsp. tular
MNISNIKIMLLGSGELGKEFIIAAQRLGIHTIVVDRYKNAPAMQVAHESYVIDMLNSDALEQLILAKNPTYIVPEIEAINTDSLVKLEAHNFNIIPCAKATKLTMDRQGIRALAAQQLNLQTSKFAFANSEQEYLDVIQSIGLPFVIKPVMSSSGKGQSIVKEHNEIKKAWDYAQNGSRGHAKGVIVEQFIDFDYEITLLTVRHKDGTSFCDPIGHIQKDGDYRFSWQPHTMPDTALAKSQEIAKEITDALGGYGVFGVELFIKGDEVFFNEVSPRPHDTGMVTLISQNINEFELHLRAIVGLPIPDIQTLQPSASAAILLEGDTANASICGIDKALADANVDIRIFGKKEIHGKRRMGVVLAKAQNTHIALETSKQALAHIHLTK